MPSAAGLTTNAAQPLVAREVRRGRAIPRGDAGVVERLVGRPRHCARTEIREIVRAHGLLDEERAERREAREEAARVGDGPAAVRIQAERGGGRGVAEGREALDLAIQRGVVRGAELDLEGAKAARDSVEAGLHEGGGIVGEGDQRARLEGRAIDAGRVRAPAGGAGRGARGGAEEGRDVAPAAPGEEIEEGRLDREAGAGEGLEQRAVRREGAGDRLEGWHVVIDLIDGGRGDVEGAHGAVERLAREAGDRGRFTDAHATRLVTEDHEHRLARRGAGDRERVESRREDLHRCLSASRDLSFTLAPKWTSLARVGVSP